MATPTPPAPPVGPDTLVTIKILQNESVNRRVKIPLRELGARVFPQKIRSILAIPPHFSLSLQRYSDSAACYVQLDSENPAVYKQLYRAAKAKLKLRIKVTSAPMAAPVDAPAATALPEVSEPNETKRFGYLDTVLGSPLSNTMPKDAEAPGSPPQSTSPLPSDADQRPPDYALRFSEDDGPNGSFRIDCNHCGKVIIDHHYHCGICDDGDYDLCFDCVSSGVTCPGDDHWLLKRMVQNGIINNSITETLAPKRAPASSESKPPSSIQQPPVQEKTPVKEEPAVPAPPTAHVLIVGDKRTCDSCYHIFPETKMVTCKTCDDYDLCFACLLKNAHCHSHSFSMIRGNEIAPENVPTTPYVHHALCDGCDKRIVGARHKCLNCPDFDYCSSCIDAAPQTHPGHNFVPVYEAIPRSIQSREVHHNIYCDGPLCRNKPSSTCIVGVRYKCAICHDTDFCSSCEALPTNPHNRTHPLIKFQTGVRNVSVSTLGDDGFGGRQVVMGDRSAPVVPAPPPCTTTPPVVSQTSATQTTNEDEHSREQVQEAEKAEPRPETTPSPQEAASSPVEEHGAYFVRDTVPDGTLMTPSHVFEQTWTLFNPGPLSWPVGTSVGYVSGDSMFNVDSDHPSSTEALKSAMSSNELTHPVGPSETAKFTVTLKSPQHSGTSISYWRMKLPDGTPFGHKLWCEIKVAEEPQAVEAPVEQPAQTKPENALTESNMIFPKLEKESPVSSTHEAMSTAPPAPPLSTSDEQDILEDVESLTLEDVETEDDTGFLTDEEYDILDASDRESATSKHA